jgi:Protein of unknown function (DUF3048) N-terminal domain/Protein of unknown function (DUF3048) C-terminal domain
VRRVALSLSALTAAGLLLSACGGSASSSPEASGSQSVQSGADLTQFWPLTGLEVPSDQSAELDHPVLVTKMDNTTSSAPQVGLSHADMVVEELVEGGLTRLAAFFYSDIPKNVGPVRSMRASDIAIVSPVHASIVTSGAAPRTIGLIKAADIPFYGQGTKGFYRAADRPSPYNLMAHLDQVAEVAKAEKATPPDYFSWGSESVYPKGPKATHISAQFSGGHTTQWFFTNGSYHNTNSNAPAGDQFPATTVLVLRVKEGDAGYLDPAGNHVPKTILVGKGNALLFHDRHVVKATWHKGAKAASPITLTTKKGALKVPAGHTWMELVPISGGNVTWTKK